MVSSVVKGDDIRLSPKQKPPSGLKNLKGVNFAQEKILDLFGIKGRFPSAFCEFTEVTHRVFLINRGAGSTSQSAAWLSSRRRRTSSSLAGLTVSATSVSRSSWGRFLGYRLQEQSRDSSEECHNL